MFELDLFAQGSSSASSILSEAGFAVAPTTSRPIGQTIGQEVNKTQDIQNMKSNPIEQRTQQQNILAEIHPTPTTHPTEQQSHHRLLEDYASFLDMNPAEVEVHENENAYRRASAGHSSPSLFETLGEGFDGDLTDFYFGFEPESKQQDQAQHQQAQGNADEPDHFTAEDAALLASTMIPSLEDPYSSTTSTLLTSFETPAIVPSSTATQFCGDFSSSPDQPLLGDMFPSTKHQNQNMAMASDFGCEPAFDDVDFQTLQRNGLFNLPLFGGMPQSQPQARPSPQANNQHRVSFSSETTEVRNSPAPPVTTDPCQLADFAASQMTTPSAHTLVLSPVPVAHTVSPVDILGACNTPRPPVPATHSSSPLLETIDSPGTSACQSPALPSEAGKAGRKSYKRKKPYEPTGTRATSRPLLDADAPTMPKTYAAPGKTTKKAIPVGFQKKLKLPMDVHGDAVLPDGASKDILDEIEEKRRKNCVAARESRRRKQEHLNGLKTEITQWRDWAGKVEEALRSAGLADALESLGPTPAFMDLEEQ